MLNCISALHPEVVSKKYLDVNVLCRCVRLCGGYLESLRFDSKASVKRRLIVSSKDWILYPLRNKLEENWRLPKPKTLEYALHLFMKSGTIFPNWSSVTLMLPSIRVITRLTSCANTRTITVWAWLLQLSLRPIKVGTDIIWQTRKSTFFFPDFSKTPLPSLQFVRKMTTLFAVSKDLTAENKSFFHVQEFCQFVLILISKINQLQFKKILFCCFLFDMFTESYVLW